MSSTKNIPSQVRETIRQFYAAISAVVPSLNMHTRKLYNVYIYFYTTLCRGSSIHVVSFRIIISIGLYRL
jgi:hypothetical protein